VVQGKLWIHIFMDSREKHHELARSMHQVAVVEVHILVELACTAVRVVVVVWVDQVVKAQVVLVTPEEVDLPQEAKAVAVVEEHQQ
jgi:uncharacterized protein YunC (DUF1805 family)